MTEKTMLLLPNKTWPYRGGWRVCRAKGLFLGVQHPDGCHPGASSLLSRGCSPLLSRGCSPAAPASKGTQCLLAAWGLGPHTYGKHPPWLNRGLVGAPTCHQGDELTSMQEEVKWQQPHTRVPTGLRPLPLSGLAPSAQPGWPVLLPPCPSHSCCQ